MTLNLDDQDVRAALDPRQNVEARNVLGGPAPERVREAIRLLRKRLATEEAALNARAQQQIDGQRRLEQAASGYLR